jgi:hypothetical protein
MMQHYRFEAQPCPWCGTPLNANAPYTPGELPTKGSISVCCECAQPVMFGRDMKLKRVPDDLEKHIKEKHPREYEILLAMQQAVRDTDRRSPSEKCHK